MHMNVKQLIQNLEKYPEDMEVYYNDWNYGEVPVETLEPKTIEDEDGVIEVLLLDC